MATFIGSGDLRRHKLVSEEFVTRFEIHIFPRIAPESEQGVNESFVETVPSPVGLLCEVGEPEQLHERSLYQDLGHSLAPLAYA